MLSITSRGYLGPGGKHDEWAAPECAGGAAGYVDRLLLGGAHLLQRSDARRVYGGPPTDPEGLLGENSHVHHRRHVTRQRAQACAGCWPLALALEVLARGLC